MNQLSNEVLINLITSLSDFGLNPLDWDLQLSEDQIIELSFIDDPEIRIKGKYEDKHWAWLELSEI